MLFELEPEDPRYTRLDEGRGTKELTKLETFLRNAAKVPNAFAKCAFVGSRGTGKSTYLRHLERDLEREGTFTPVHIYLDASLESDCHYSDLFLWMVDEIARQFDGRGHPVNEAALSEVAVWFAEKTISKTTEWKKEIGLTAEAEASAKTGIPGIFSLKLLARLKSMIVGSEQSRKDIRQNVQNYATELRHRVNDFLDHARAVLKDAGKPDRLLIVQDNLDRIRPRERAWHLFESGGEMLADIRADVVYTAPLVLNLAPLDIGPIFGNVFTMPNVKVRKRDGSAHRAGVDSLVTLLGKRLSLKAVFRSGSVVRYLAEMSGGSVRELLRLVSEAQLEAQVSHKPKVDMKSARAAVTKKAVNFTRLLMPMSVYFPILAEIHRTKGAYQISEAEATTERVASAREFFAELIGNEAVLEYNGDDSWYDVHPAIRETGPFQDALAKTSQA
nr:AAA family ATPase [Prosthecobacter sp.]